MKEIFKNDYVLDESNLVEYCRGYLRSPESVSNMNNKFIQLLHAGLDQIERFRNTGEVEYEHIELGLNMLTVITLETVITDSLKTFIDFYTRLAGEVNDATIKNNIVFEKVDYLQRFINNNLKLSESIRLSKEILVRANNCANFKPPVFELSAHYINLLRN